MKRLFGTICLAAAAAAAMAAGCSKDDPITVVSFDVSAVYLTPGQQITVGYSATNITSCSVTEVPEGWDDAVLDTSARTVQIKAPTTFGDEVECRGEVVLTVQTMRGTQQTASLFVDVTDPVDLSGSPANSYLLNRKQTPYLLDAVRAGDGQTRLETASVGVIWQTSSSLIQYLQLVDGKISLYVDADEDDGTLLEGNALIGAYDEEGTLLWSWHLWIADYDPDAEGGSVDFNGRTLMTRNLGALAEDNSSTENVLLSYGLYYQWGRKDPFPGPLTYKGTSTAYIYNGSGTRVTMAVEESDAESGTEEYARQNPLTFIAGVEESSYDWLYADHSIARWAEEKTANDPCPAGWQVASPSVFSGVEIANPLEDTGYEAYLDSFGWTLSDGRSESLFIGAGRRIYTNGTIQNVYNPVVRSTAIEAQPWIGLYWTSESTVDTQAEAFYFWFNKANVAGSGIENKVPHYRANGMQIRCVKAR